MLPEMKAQMAALTPLLASKAQVAAVTDGLAGIAQFDANEAQLKAAEKQILSGQEEVKKKITEVYDN